MSNRLEQIQNLQLARNFAKKLKEDEKAMTTKPVSSLTEAEKCLLIARRECKDAVRFEQKEYHEGDVIVTLQSGFKRMFSLDWFHMGPIMEREKLGACYYKGKWAITFSPDGAEHNDCEIIADKLLDAIATAYLEMLYPNGVKTSELEGV